MSFSLPRWRIGGNSSGDSIFVVQASLPRGRLPGIQRLGHTHSFSFPKSHSKRGAFKNHHGVTEYTEEFERKLHQ